MEIEWMLIIHSLIDYSLFRLDPALVLVQWQHRMMNDQCESRVPQNRTA